MLIHSILHFILYIAYILIQCTWGLPQTIGGLFVFLRHIKSPHSFYKGCIRTDWNRQDGVSLGLFIFVAGEDTAANSPETAAHGTPVCSRTSPAAERMARHEYGHTLQSLMLGPLYLFIIGLPSFLWCQLPFFQQKRKLSHISYYSFYPEKWADRLGKAERRD